MNERTAEAKSAARSAGLRYVDDRRPGIRRERTKAGFRYRGADGKLLVDEDELARIRRLAIPPAYEDVWISPLPNGHIQATGRDARGRKQYRYHARWREVRDEAKFDRVLHFASVLPALRERIDRDLSRPGLPREKVLATAVRLLELTLIRVGNDEYAKTNHSYGLTTLRDRHVRVDGTRVRFHFRGKSGVEHDVDLKDRRLATIVRRLLDIPGQELFRYLDDEGEPQSVQSHDVNEYLRDATGYECTAKDFRTFAGTVLCGVALAAQEGIQTKTQAREAVVSAIKSVAARLGNTPSVCRKAYIHPIIIDAFLRDLELRLPKAKSDESAVVGALQRLMKRPEPTVSELLNRSLRRMKKAARMKATA